MTGGLNLSAPLRRFLQVLLLLWLMTLVLGLIERYVLHWPASSWYPFYRWEDRFSDFTTWKDRFQYFHKSGFFDMPGLPFFYPAFAAFVLKGFYLLGSPGLPVYFLMSFLAFGVSGVFLGRAMQNRGLASTETVVFLVLSFLFSYPFWFLVDRANIEMVNWILIAAGVAAYWHKRWYLAATFLGIAVSFKIFPFVFLGLLLSARRFRALIWALVVWAVLSIGSTWLMGPTFHIALAGMAQGLRFYKLNYILEIHPQEAGFDHSLFALIKLLAFRAGAEPHSRYWPMLNWYMVICAASGIVLFFWKIWKLPRANQILALTIASILFPPISADYRLVHLYIPWGVLVLLAVKEDGRRITPGLAFALGCLGFLMAPESNFVLTGIKFAGQLKAIVLLILFFVSIFYPFPENEFDNDREELDAITEPSTMTLRGGGVY